MEALLDGLLAYSRATRVSDLAGPVDVRALVEDIADLSLFRDRADLTLGGLPVIQASEAPLRQVFQNLMENAVKHHGPGRARIEIGVDDRGDCHEFFVRDDGPGIDEAFRERAFELFQTLRPRDAVEGSGIGLALARKLVARFGGRIWIGPGPEGGAEVRFTWPKAG
jgi:signal transduction histidine kinase